MVTDDSKGTKPFQS